MAIQDLKNFIRQHRSDEANFEKIFDKLKQEDSFLSHHADIMQKAEEYKTAKETRQEAWPEFEKFITEIEKSLLEEK